MSAFRIIFGIPAEDERSDRKTAEAIADSNEAQLLDVAVGQLDGYTIVKLGIEERGLRDAHKAAEGIADECEGLIFSVMPDRNA